MELENTSLTLFFTGGVSLKTWAEVGNLDRELEIYKRLSKKLKNVNIDLPSDDFSQDGNEFLFNNEEEEIF